MLKLVLQRVKGKGEAPSGLHEYTGVMAAGRCCPSGSMIDARHHWTALSIDTGQRLEKVVEG